MSVWYFCMCLLFFFGIFYRLHKEVITDVGGALGYSVDGRKGCMIRAILVMSAHLEGVVWN